MIVAIGHPTQRKQAVERLPAGTTFSTIVPPIAVVSKWVEIGEGSETFEFLSFL